MLFVYGLIWLFMIALGVTAVVALVWAIRTGQFRDLQSGAYMIFDEDEPEGEMTDAFPSERGGDDDRAAAPDQRSDRQHEREP